MAGEDWQLDSGYDFAGMAERAAAERNAPTGQTGASSGRLYVSRPQRVEAVHWTGDNWSEVLAFGVPGAKTASTAPERGDLPSAPATAGALREWTGLPLQLLAGKDGAQGWVPVPIGHWIVRNPGDNSDMWPVDPDYFAAKYERDLPKQGWGV